jgi:hypothetical protein
MKPDEEKDVYDMFSRILEGKKFQANSFSISHAYKAYVRS